MGDLKEAQNIEIIIKRTKFNTQIKKLETI